MQYIINIDFESRKILPRQLYFRASSKINSSIIPNTKCLLYLVGKLFISVEALEYQDNINFIGVFCFHSSNKT